MKLNRTLPRIANNIATISDSRAKHEWNSGGDSSLVIGSDHELERYTKEIVKWKLADIHNEYFWM